MQRTASTVQLSAVASTAIQTLLMRPTSPGTLLGTSDHAAWIGLGDDVVVVSDREAVRLPNAVEIAVEHLGRWIHNDDAVAVGDGIIAVGILTVSPRRWFDPQPVLGRCSISTLRTNVEILSERIGRQNDLGLGKALAREDVDGVLGAARHLLGKGTGLTPEGDDLLAGAIATYVLLGRCLDCHPGFPDQLAEPFGELIRSRTTSFSATLIRHALRGEVTKPFADVLRALTGRGDISASLDKLVAIGHSSGPALAAGLQVGSSAILLENSQ